MFSIVINSLVLLGTITLISYIEDFCEHSKISNSRSTPMLVLGVILCITSFLNIMMSISGSDMAVYIIYIVDRFARILFISTIFISVKDYTGSAPSSFSRFISFYAFSNAALFFGDTMATKGTLDERYGIRFLSSANLYLRIAYGVVYAVYFAVLFWVIYRTLRDIGTRRERPGKILLVLCLLSCVLGFLMDLVSICTGPAIVIPHTVFDLGALLLMYHMVRYRRMILLCADDYATELSPDKTDIVFILNDRQMVSFESERAKALEGITGDSFMGRYFFDILDFSQENMDEILKAPSDVQVGTDAVYKKSQQHVNVVSQNRTDMFGDILSTCIRVYNMEPREMGEDVRTDSIRSADYVESLLDDSIELTHGARVLLAAKKDTELADAFSNACTYYNIIPDIIADSDEALEAAGRKEYDIIFISDKLDDSTAFELAVKIRGLSENLKDKPLILVSSCDINNIFMEMLDAGFTDYIYDPIDKIKFDSCLKTWLAVG